MLDEEPQPYGSGERSGGVRFHEHRIVGWIRPPKGHWLQAIPVWRRGPVLMISEHR